MVATAPHYLLLSETQEIADGSTVGGCWRFALQRMDGSDWLEVSDTEPGVGGERLQLLAIIRGLEALDQPSRVTIVTASQYVSRGIRRDLQAWRDNQWRWESFGAWRPIKHQDLWIRLDRALSYHSATCRSWQYGMVRNRLVSESIGSKPRGKRHALIASRLFGFWARAARKWRHRPAMESMTGASCA